MPSKPPAMLKSQPTNTRREKKKKKKNHPREHCHAILGVFISDLTWGKAAECERFLPSAHQTQMQQNLTRRVMDLSVEQHE